MSDLTPQDEALLDRARADLEPSADDRLRNKRRLYAQLGIGIGAATAAASTSASAGTLAGAATGSGALAFAVKVGISVVLVGALVGTGVVAVRHPGSRATAPAASVAEAPGTPKVAESPPLPVAIPVARPESAPVVDSPIEARNASVLPARAPTRAEPVVRDRTRALSSSSVLAPFPEETPVTTAPGPELPASPPGPATVAAEAALLRDADTALKAGDPARAQALLDRHASSFPNGTLVEERESERVVVLCALGQTDQARAAAAAFLRDRPRSPLATRVRSSCGGR